MHYTLHQLKIFRAVVEQNSISKAARSLHLSQPAVSIQLKNFQDQFESPLTEVIGKQLYVTEFGGEIFSIAGNILAESEALQYKTKQYQGLHAGRLAISSASTGKYIAPIFLAGFMADKPGIDLRLDVSNKDQVLKALRANTIDFAFVSVLPEDLAVEEEVLMENKLYLVSNKAGSDQEQALIFREKGSATRRAMDAYFGQVKARKSLELTSTEAVKQAVIAGLGQSLLPLIGLRNEIHLGQLHILPAPGLPIVTQWRLIWLKAKKLSPLASAYLAYLRSHKQEIIKAHFDWHQTVL